MIRFIYLLGSIVKFALLLLARELGLYRSSNPKFLRNFFEDAGGSFVKFGQLLALRVDVLPQEYSEEMLDLLDNVEPFAYQDVKEQFLKELGALPEEVFAKFEKEPFAAASFGQVHGAKLKDKSVVIVKVMRPGIESDVEVDFIFLNILARVGNLFFKIESLNWKEFAAEFMRWTRQELNYLVEAEHAQRMYDNNKNNPNIIIPKTYHELTTRRILVQEYIEGYPLSRILRGLKDGRLTRAQLKNMGVDIEKVPHIMAKEIIRQCFVDKFFHADPHPGNIIVLPGNKIAFIDFGITGEVSFDNEKSFINFMERTAHKDFENAIYYFADFSGVELKQMIGSAFPASIDASKIEEFFRVLSHQFAQSASQIAFGKAEDLHQLKTDYTSVLFEIFKAGDYFKIKIPPQALLFVRVLSMTGILAKQLDNHFLITEDMKSFFKDHPVDSLIRDPLATTPFKRLSREKALEKLSYWVAHLQEASPATYKVVSNYLSRYNLR